jgi:hypothetical protein
MQSFSREVSNRHFVRTTIQCTFPSDELYLPKECLLSKFSQRCIRRVAVLLGGSLIRCCSRRCRHLFCPFDYDRFDFVRDRLYYCVKLGLISVVRGDIFSRITLPALPLSRQTRLVFKRYKCFQKLKNNGGRQRSGQGLNVVDLAFKL